MTLSPVSTFQAYFQRLVKGVRNPNTLLPKSDNVNPEGILQRVRNIDRAQLISGGVVAAELLGFFTVGEMIGRFKLVGYRGDTGAHH
jgi:F-type H+-transporting ATPase subunit g